MLKLPGLENLKKTTFRRDSRQEDIGFESSLTYKVSSRASRAVNTEKSCLEKPKRKKRGREGRRERRKRDRGEGRQAGRQRQTTFTWLNSHQHFPLPQV